MKAACDAQRVPTPWPGIDVEQLQATVASVQDELHLDHARQAEPTQNPRGGFREARDFDRFHETAAEAVIDRILPCPSRGDRARDGSFFSDRPEREMVLAGDDLLHLYVVSGNNGS